jgi:hypothetical protein
VLQKFKLERIQINEVSKNEFFSKLLSVFLNFLREDGGSTFLQNVATHLLGYAVSYPARYSIKG